MFSKRTRLIVLTCIIAIATIWILAKCVPSVSADTIGPPTIESHLLNINSNMKFIQLMIIIVGGLLSAFIGVTIYAYRRDIYNVNQKADGAFTEINLVKREFLSTKNHDRACPHIGAVEPGH